MNFIVPEWKLGNIVERAITFQDEPVRQGVVVEVYPGTPDLNGRREKFYAVRWNDTGFTERGYLGFGLRAPATVVPTVRNSSGGL